MIRRRCYRVGRVGLNMFDGGGGEIVTWFSMYVIVDEEVIDVRNHYE